MRARNPLSDWLLYAAVGSPAIISIQRSSQIEFNSKGIKTKDRERTVTATSNPPPTTFHFPRRKKYPEGKTSGSLIRPPMPSRTPEEPVPSAVEGEECQKDEEHDDLGCVAKPDAVVERTVERQ